MAFMTIDEATALGWGRSRYAIQEACVSCPCCDTLSVATRHGEGCRDCGWAPGQAVDRGRPSSHNGLKPEEDLRPSVVEVAMASDNPDPGDLASAEREERLLEILSGLKGWPLDKRETFVAFNMMGLTSRLQPLQVESSEHQRLVVSLAIKLADLTVSECEKK